MSNILDEIDKDLNKIESIEEAIDMAITLEQQGREFYLDMASKIKNPGVKDMYRYLADEEKKHEEYLTQFKNDMSPVLEEEEDLPDFKVSFSSEFDDRLDEIGVLLGALRLERKSEDLYKKLAEMTGDMEQKHFFEKIASVERGHYEIIEGLLDTSTGFRMQT
ncbi:MAG: ferritin family protein [Methanohalobium sp.]|uniref:ferritin family protein n=1 Tax=Methanohalobium sp. TaxID=2837493 RepID=UPI00397B2B54